MATFTVPNYSPPPPIPDADGWINAVTVRLTGTITGLSLSLIDLQHTYPDDLDLILFAPDPTHNLMVMSDAGGSADLVAADLMLSDGAAQELPDAGPIVSGTSYRPTNHGEAELSVFLDGTPYTIGNPQPAGGQTFATTFGGTELSGTWRLLAYDDADDDTGSLDRWSFTATTAENHTRFSGSNADEFVTISGAATSGWFVTAGSPGITYSGIDLFYVDGGGGADTLIYFGGQHFDFDGGAGVDTFVVTTSGVTTVASISDDNLANVERITLVDPGAAHTVIVEMGAAQFGNGGIALDGMLSASGNGQATDIFRIDMGFAASIDLGAMTMTGFGAGDYVEFRGDDDDETIRGSAASDLINGAGGADVLRGGGGDDYIFFDPADVLDQLNGGLGFDTLMLGGLGPLTSFNLFTHDFEAATTSAWDSGAAAWDYNLWTYDQAWRAIRQDLTMDDATRLVNAYTVAGVLDWTEDYSAAGNRTRFTNFDEGNAESWNTYYDLYVYNTGGGFNVRTQRFVAYDNGASQREGFDVSSAVLWRQEYGPSGLLDRYTEYDVADSLDWTSYYNLYSAGARTQQYMVFDDGTSIRNGFDALGRLDWVQEYRTNGNLSRYVDYDQAGDQTWTYAVTYYDINGNQTSRYILYDDGSELYL